MPPRASDSPALLDEALQIVFEPFILDVPSFCWEVVLGRKEKGSFDFLPTALISKKFLVLRTLTID